MNDFDVVIGKPDGAECGERKDCQPNEAIAEVGPEQRGDHNRDDNQQPAHGRRPGFFLMSFWALFADVLANLKFL